MKSTGLNCYANQVLPLSKNEQAVIEAKIAQKYSEILNLLRIDTKTDHNTKGTAKRVARLLVRDACGGRFQNKPRMTCFPNALNLDQLYTVGPIAIRSLCSHHFLPVIGNVWIGLIPSRKVMGLSKFNRLAQWVMGRPQIQEEATIQLADEIELLLKPKGLGVVVKANHTCMTWRGVKDKDTEMVTSVMRGTFRENMAARGEFLTFIGGQQFK